MTRDVINVRNKFTKITKHWSPRIVAQLNDYHLKLVKIEGDFVWHSHEETDEVFLVVEGDMEIEMSDKTVSLSEGDLFVVPKGVEHRPRSRKECKIMLIEPAGTVNTGDAGGDLTAAADSWV